MGKGEITEEGGEMDEWDEMEVGGNVEVEEKEVGTKETSSVGSTETTRTAKGFGFLEGLVLEEKNREPDEKIAGSRKGKGKRRWGRS